MIELFAITDDPGQPPEPLRTVRRRDLSILYAAASGTAEPTAADLWRHEEMLERLLEDRNLLPVRYGTVVKDVGAAARVLDERYDELAAALERVRGAVEIAVRVRARDSASEAPPAGLSGREYIDVKTGAARTAASVHQVLSDLARDSVTQGSDELLRAAYLVERGQVDAFVTAVRRLQEDRADLALVCTGPWPPFSFVDQGGGG